MTQDKTQDKTQVSSVGNTPSQRPTKIPARMPEESELYQRWSSFPKIPKLPPMDDVVTVRPPPQEVQS